MQSVPQPIEVWMGGLGRRAREQGRDACMTIHVYGGEMTYCHVFEPVDGGFLRKYKELAYTA